MTNLDDNTLAMAAFTEVFGVPDTLVQTTDRALVAVYWVRMRAYAINEHGVFLELVFGFE